MPVTIRGICYKNERRTLLAMEDFTPYILKSTELGRKKDVLKAADIAKHLMKLRPPLTAWKQTALIGFEWKTVDIFQNESFNLRNNHLNALYNHYFFNAEN